ncbi:glycosyltransferase [Isoptericola sp. BMS4]|uniref:glycosyltransferase n=1 Tax=Isoptericola sp. BMS4 TaxID=2527875 RepID=UPI001421BCC1|nr:glycosyltransferase [Isoptericola sp. BMS4]
MTDGVVLAHDYATQRGGAERVALLLAEAFPGSPLYTTLHDPDGTFPELDDLDVRPGPLDRVAALRHHHRLALPLLAPAVSRQRLAGDVLVASSTGWAHGYRGARRTVVYCHAPARWLYQRDRYLGAPADVPGRARKAAARAALAGLGPALRAWDVRAARRADVYLANSTVTRDAVRAAYGIEAQVLPPPPALPPGPERPVPGVEPGALLCVARLLPYKNVDVVVAAAQLLRRPLVVVGDGPDRQRLAALAARDPRTPVRFVGRVDDDGLRWLYRHAAVLVAASYEDYGLTPLEAGTYRVPVVALRAGGYLDTVAEGVNGTFVDAPRADVVADAVAKALAADWDGVAIDAHVAAFGRDRFLARIREVVTALRDAPAPTVGGAR